MIELNKGKLEITEDEDDTPVKTPKVSSGQKIGVLIIMLIGLILSIVGLVMSVSTSKVVPTHIQEEILQGEEEQQVTTEVNIEPNTEIAEDNKSQNQPESLILLFNLMRKVSAFVLMIMSITMLMSIVKFVATGNTEEIHLVVAKLIFIIVLNILTIIPINF